MNPALLILMRLQFRGLLRRLLRGARTVRGALFFALGLLIFAMWLVPVFIGGNIAKADPDNVRAVMPLILLGVVLGSALTSAGDKAVIFTPAEVDFLFSGPFPRRQLLLYKLGKSAFAALFSALLMSVALLRFASLWVACFLGCLLALLFVQWLSTALVIVGQSIGEQARTRSRQVLLIAVIILAVLAVRELLVAQGLSNPVQMDLKQAALDLGQTQAGRVLLSPVSSFAQVLTAKAATDLLKWTPIAVAINAFLLFIVLWLDANFLEIAANASQKRYEQLRRMTKGGIMSASAGATSRRRLPQPPFWGGMGPILWRQLTGATRGGKGLLIVLAALAISIGPTLLVSQRGKLDIVVMFPALIWVSIILASLLKFDFRSDLDAMDTLKSLPLRPSAVALGQIVAPAIVLTIMHWLLLIATAVVLRTEDAIVMLLSAAVIAPCLNLLMFAAENLVFLLMPARPSTAGPGDFHIFGRQMFALILRTLLVGAGAGLAFAIAYGVHLAAGDSLPVLVAVASVLLLAEAAAMVPLIGSAFRRFDPSTQTPP